MKFIRIALSLGLIAACVILVLSEEIADYEYEDDGAGAPPTQPQPAQRGRLPLISSSRQNKGPTLIGNANKLNKQAGGKIGGGTKAASPPAPPPQEAQEEELEEYDEAAEEPVEQTSTEAPKKTIKPTVRPFRSNDDLLAALKRRRQQVQSSGVVVDRTTTTTSPTTAVSSAKKSSNSFGAGGRRNRHNGNRAQPTPQEQEYVEPEPVKKGPASRKFNSKASTRAPVLEEIPADEQPKPKFGRGGRG